jgi:tetratricopeptide (TPR) repeat protein
MTTNKHLIDSISSDDPKNKIWKSRMAVARMAYHEGQFKDAEHLLALLLEQSKELKESTFATASTYCGLGAVCAATNRIEQAQKYYELGLNLVQASRDKADSELCAVILRFQANLLWDKDDLSGAQRNLERSVELLTAVGENGEHLLALSLCDLSFLHIIANRLDLAKPLIAKAMSIISRTSEAGSADYLRADMIYQLSIPGLDQESKYNIFLDTAIKEQYQLGSHNPHLVRALARFAVSAKESGRTDLIDLAKEHFEFLAK